MGYGNIYTSMRSFPETGETVALKEMNSSSLRSHQLPVVPQLRRRLQEPHPHPCWDSDCLSFAQLLCMQWHWWVHTCHDPTMTDRYDFAADIHYPWLLQSFHPSSMIIPESWRWGCDMNVLFIAQHYSLLSSTCWPVVLCRLITIYCKKKVLVKVERCADLRI